MIIKKQKDSKHSHQHIKKTYYVSIITFKTKIKKHHSEFIFTFLTLKPLLLTFLTRIEIDDFNAKVFSCIAKDLQATQKYHIECINFTLTKMKRY